MRRAAVVVAVAVFLAFSGAFGSGPAPFGRRLAYWLTAIAGGAVIEAAMDRWLFTRFDWLDDRPWPGGVVRTLAIALPITLLAWSLFVMMLAGGRWDTRLLPGFLLPVTAVTAGMVTLNMLVTRTPPATHVAPPGASRIAPPPVRLLQRLPPRLHGAPLLAVQAEDHYLRLHTARGSELILLRLADALAELNGIEGAQVHRSWWVAREAVQGVTREDGRTLLRLPGGVQAPVSRTYVKALREAGWF